MLAPRAFNARCKGIARFAVLTRIGPAKSLGFDPGSFWFNADLTMSTATMGLADGMAAASQCSSFFVIHSHPGEGLTNMQSGPRRVWSSVHAFGVDIDEAHVNRGERVLQRRGIIEIAIAVLTWSKPFAFRTPIDVFFRAPDILTPKPEPEGLQAHRLVGHRTGKDDQVGPRQSVAILPLDGPKQAARLVEACIVRPGVQRRETDVARSATTAAILGPVGPGRVPGKPDHQTTIMAPVSRPPVLTVSHQCFHIGFDSLKIQAFDRLTMVVVRIHRVRAGTALVQDVEVE